MTDVLLSFRGREIRQSDVQFLRELIAQNPGTSRWRLSKIVCQAWNWVQPNGQLRDQVCRTLMLKLHRAGHIELPPALRTRPNYGVIRRRAAQLELCDTTVIEGSLASLGPLEIRQVRRADGEAVFNSLIDQYHYLQFRRPIGEHLKYLISAGGRPIACMAWNSGPLKLSLRDQFIGAPRDAYAHNLHCIAYNSRYLIVPWVRVKGLASHLLSRVSHRISQDWQELYKHPIHLLETFVDTERFKGVCYQAANWKLLGRTDGRGTRSKTGAETSIKELWAYPLSKDFRSKLTQ